ncbi:Lanosterol 14-alpha-demethylase [Ceratobasidium sp. 394]|nr:Lanosterol 14-alpha-demethylase [Ceratobasidium sp. 394]KAG9101051.1 Lanosterol 14-alpha-demethylase [Ceratobasidium sp. UAMH 11750]
MSNSTASLPFGPALSAVASLPAPALALAVFVGIPVLAIVINVAWQLLIPRDPSLPPLVFHYVPIIGSAVAYGNDPLGFFFSCREKYGDLFTFVLLGRQMTVALGPKGSNFILGGKLSQVSAEDAYTHLTTPVFGKDVVYDVPNHVLMEQKKFVKFGLTTENFRAYVDMITEETNDLIQKDLSVAACQRDSQGWGRFHAFKTLAQLTILTASRTLQGKEVRSSLDKSFADLYQDLDGGFTPINFLFPNLPLPSYWRRDRAQKKMSDFYVDIINKRRAGSDEHEHDMLAALATQQYKDGRPLTDREMAHIMIALLMAGQHTSSATSSWALLHLADRPDIAEKLYEEQVKTFGNQDGTLRPLTYEEMKDLPVLSAVIRETLRMHPPIHSIIRKCIGDMVVPASLAAPAGKSAEGRSYVIPKGHYLLACPAVAQVDPLVWREADKWDPLRWLDPTGAAAQASSMYNDEHGEKVDYGWGAVSKGTESPYQPFGAGRHRCIGEQFANLQLGTILSTIIRSMELRIENRVPDHNYHTMIVLPKDPCGIKFKPRT